MFIIINNTIIVIIIIIMYIIAKTKAEHLDTIPTTHLFSILESSSILWDQWFWAIDKMNTQFLCQVSLEVQQMAEYVWLGSWMQRIPWCDVDVDKAWDSQFVFEIL